MVIRTIPNPLIARSSSAITSKCWRFMEPLLERPCRVLFAGPHFHAAWGLTKEVMKERKHTTSEIELLHAPTTSEIVKLAPTAHIAIPFMERFPSTFLEQSTKLRLVQQFGVGLEGVDVPKATQLGIAVSNIPAQETGNAQATSEHALFLTMSLLRHIDDLHRRFQQNELGGLPIPQTLYQKNVTLVGYGSVGKVLCQYLLMMGANVTVVRNQDWSTTTTTTSTTREGNDNHPNFVKATSLQSALPTTDILILVCLMTPETYHMINNKTIDLLPKDGKSIIVNVGRGQLVEHGAILKGIKSGHIAGFASDVGVGHPTKPSEPWDPQDELSNHPNVLFTPHVGGYTDFAYTAMANKVVDAVECILDSKAPPAWVNNR